MLIKSQSEVHLHTGRSVHFHPGQRARPSFSIFQESGFETNVNSAVRSCDSYKTGNTDDGKAKSRDTCTTNCEAGTRERPANLFILPLPCRSSHASLGFTYVSFSRRSLHTSPFLHKYNMCTLHSGQDFVHT